jgi:hypothetical protein
MRLFTLLAASLLASCASTDTKSLQGAVTSPLNDLNLVHAPIPAVLADAQKAPYGLAEPSSCAELKHAVRALDEVLGADLDSPVTAANPSLIERGSAAVGGAAQNAAEGVVPYRGWVRKLSGAERYSKQVTAAVAAGAVRRGFLKGVAKARFCDLSA